VADREETYVEGDAYVAGTSIIEFTSTAALEPVMAAIGRNLESMSAEAAS
jgi:hypothetical protein